MGGRKCLSSAGRAGDQLQPVLGPGSRWGDPRPEPRLTRARIPGAQSEEAAGWRTLRLHEAGGSGPGHGRAASQADVARMGRWPRSAAPPGEALGEAPLSVVSSARPEPRGPRGRFAGRPARPALRLLCGRRWARPWPSGRRAALHVSPSAPLSHAHGGLRAWPVAAMEPLKWGPLSCPVETSRGLQAACLLSLVAPAAGPGVGAPCPLGEGPASAQGWWGYKGSPGGPAASDDSPCSQALGPHGGPMRRLQEARWDCGL